MSTRVALRMIGVAILVVSLAIADISPAGIAWSLLSLPAILLLWVIAHHRSPLVREARLVRRRKRLGLCTKCGYDLRGHSFGQRCPECGCRHFYTDLKNSRPSGNKQSRQRGANEADEESR